MPRATNTAIPLLLAGLLIVATGYATALLTSGRVQLFGAWCLALGASLVLTGMLALAAKRASGIPRTLRVTLALVFVATFGGLAYALAAPAPTSGGPLLLGLPRVTALMLLVTGLVPLIVLPLAYARAFERDVLSAGDIERLRASIQAAGTAQTDA